MNSLTQALIQQFLENQQPNVGYRAGRFNPNSPAERLRDRGIGIVNSKVGLLGTGHYFMGNLEDVKKLKQQSGYSVISKINLDSYNLYKPNDPVNFYENIKATTYYLHGLKYKDFENPDVKQNVKNIIRKFAKYLNLDPKKTANIFKEYLKDIFKRNDGDLLSNRLLANYDGIDLRGTEFDDFGAGSLIFNGKLKDGTYEVIENLTERIRFQPYNFDEDEIQFIDDFADEKMDPIDIDLSGNHFFDRLNDPRNRPEIEPFELEDFFSKLSTQKDKFIGFLNKYKEVVAKDKQTDINIPFMKQANKAIAKTVMRKRNFKTSNPVVVIEEGRYDQEGLIISRFTLNQFKENLGQEFEENFEAGLLEDIEYTLELRFYPNDTLGPPFFRVDAASDENALNITINYDPSIFPKTYNALNAEIKDSIRHELEHIGQFNFPKGTKHRKGTPNKGFDYYTLDFEIPAFVQGIYKKAKTQKISFSQALEDFLDERVDELSPQEKDKLRQTYLDFARKNLPAAQIDEIQTPANEDDVNPKELKIGIKVEMEHTDSKEKAKVIALQHLAEDPKYYTKLAKVGLEEQQEDKLKPLIIDFTSFLVTDGMKIHPFPKIKFIDNDTKNAEDPLGKTAYYNPQEKSVTLFTLKRHPKDILRSYSHELVHHMQNLEGRLKPMTTTNVHEDGELAEIEKEAHELGSLNLRKWEDSKKTNTNG